MKIKVAVVLMLVVAGAVYAQDKWMQQKLESGFVTFDRNKDATLDQDEFQSLGEYSPKLKGKPQAVAYLFGVLDQNRDGKLSRDEYLKITSVGSSSTAKTTSESAASTPSADTLISVDQTAFFEKKIRPVLIERCYGCHSEKADEIGGGLVLDTREGIRRGGNSGPGIVPGNLDMSLVVEAVRYSNKDLQMPPPDEGGKLPDSVIADLEQWVKMGAPDPRDGRAMDVHPEWDMKKAASHWAYRKITEPSLPKIDNNAWAKSDIDRFVMHGLESNGLAPVRDALPEALARRLYFDLIGLPPTPEDRQAFLKAYAADSESAVENLVDTLLNSPRFGERWGRHWLDVARYAESTGKDVNLLMPHNWRYRDYVIQAFNDDKPIDDFFREQLAGDLLPAQDARDRAAKQIATGFLAIGPHSLNERNSSQFALDLADEQIDTVSQAMLGITIACARCHDHKFDPIRQRDYYALAGIFLSTETCYGTTPTFQNIRKSNLIELEESSGAPRMPNRLAPTRRVELEKELTKMERYASLQFYGTAIQSVFSRTGFDLNNDPQKLVRLVAINAKLGELRMELDTYHQDGRQKLLAVGVRDYPRTLTNPLPDKPRSLTESFEKYSGRPNRFRILADSPFYVRGDVEKPSESVPRGLPSLIGAESTPPASSISTSESGRRELAEWIVSDENPLTARVFVNRVWYWLFGSGIVQSVDNFGTTGRSPSNQALLDHLAVQFQENDWSLKSLIRAIVLSRTYRLSTDFDKRNFEADPENAWVWRMSPRRLEAECIRDAMLTVAGKLQTTPPVGSIVAQQGDASIGGYDIKSLRAPVSDEQFLTVNTVYRSIYLPIPRNAVPESLTVFDFTEPSAVGGSRAVTTVPSQALYLLNNNFVADSAKQFARRLVDLEPNRRIDAAFEIALARSPLPSEVKAVRQFLAEHPNREDENAVWASFCRALLSNAEFRSLD